ncbi:MAG: DUF1045 domain-containing protein [Pseudomonadota bacterium]
MTFTRYAIYFAPPAGAGWTRFATSWLGWDMETGSPVAHPFAEGIDVAAVTRVPRKYGLHATLKPPFHLQNGRTVEALHDACASLAARHAPVALHGLEIAPLGRFLALRPIGEQDALNALAARCVQDLDMFRTPATEQELARRRSTGLTAEQDTNLVHWGYPYVLNAFRFHITLSGRLDKTTLQHVRAALDAQLGPLLPQPFRINDLALVGEAEDGRFHLIQRYVLTG